MSLTGKRILVTGGTGFLGQQVCGILRDKGANLKAPSSGECDLRRYRASCQAVSSDCDEWIDGNAEVVIHLAAYCGGIGRNLDNPARMVHDNALMACNIVDACHRYGVEKLVTVGSVCAYPVRPPRYPFVEGDLWAGYPEETNAPYGIAKRLLLTLCQAYRQQHGLNAVYLIPANLYGPGDKSDHVIPSLIRRISAAQHEHRDVITLWGTGAPTRDFLHVRDAARAIVLAAEHYDGAEPVNVGTGFATSIANLAEYLATEMGYGGAFAFDTTKPTGQPRRCLDTSRAKAAFGFEAEIPLSTGLQETVDWFRTQDRIPECDPSSLT